MTCFEVKWGTLLDDILLLLMSFLVAQDLVNVFMNNGWYDEMSLSSVKLTSILLVLKVVLGI